MQIIDASSSLISDGIGMGYQMNQNIILTGDLNSDLFSSRNNKLINTMNLFNLTNVIEKPTKNYGTQQYIT
jgi:hypothetical protein